MSLALSPFDHLAIARDGAVLTVAIDRPEARNAISFAVMDELSELVDLLERDRQTQAVILTGGGHQVFVSGGDIKEFQSVSGREAGRDMALRMQSVLDRWSALDIPSIAAIGGDAYGGGCEIALACDMRICSDAARMHFKQISLGIMTGWGGGARLQRAVGRSQALRILLTAATVDAAHALRIGLVDEVAEDALTAAQALGADISRWSPQAVRSIKRALHRGRDLPMREAIAYEAELFATTWASEDHAEGLAAFFEKRDPVWKGR